MTREDWTNGIPRLLAQRCASGHAWYLPRTRCPRCGGAVEDFEPVPVGTVVARTEVHRRADGSAGVLGIALVELDDGMRIMARCAGDAPIGARVRIGFVTAESGRLVPACEETAA